MKKSLLFLTFTLFIFLTCHSQGTTPDVCTDDHHILNQMQQSIKTDLLDIWYPRVIDHENGGYHTIFNHKWELVSSFPKMIVTQARTLWTASKAAMRYPQNDVYKTAADHGFSFLKEKAWDPQNGGFYEHIPYPADTSHVVQYKTAYGNAFAIYALSAYYNLTRKEEVLHLAQKAFQWLDDHYYDPVYGGYFQYSNLKGDTYYHKDKFNIKIISEHLQPYATYKDYNSSIHIMEAFTELYKHWADPHLKKRLYEMLTLVRDIMITEKGYIEMMYTEDWHHISFRDSSRQFLKKNSWYDHISFGHDTETAFLLLEAASFFDQVTFDQTLKIGKKVIDFSLAHGFDDNFSGIFYEGYYLKGDTTLTIINKQKQWWVQGEAMNAYLMFSLLYPDEPAYKEAFYHLWHFIDHYVIDHEHGGWFSEAISSKPSWNRRRLKAQPWKSNYHSYRSISQCIDMLTTGNIPFLKHESKSQ